MGILALFTVSFVGGESLVYDVFNEDASETLLSQTPEALVAVDIG